MLRYLIAWFLVSGADWVGYGVFRNSLTGGGMPLGMGFASYELMECDQPASHCCYHIHAVPAIWDSNSQ